eukprot:TRINITY_DN1664_c0_g1_i1.p1 TRINITY_DN1664_c0_g1~~TRINITY_DN1664_c0_g1_i1.p1  ORF type:complete len:142 (-),score=29.85 TRINITY_DN1664_c0_g1_i1:25-450(-)
MVRYTGTPAKRARTKRKKKDMDEIYQDLTRAPDVRKIVERKPDLDLPALGNFYCIVCARYFNTQQIMDEHCKTKPHKRRCKRLGKEVPYGVDPEEVYGKIDHGMELTPANFQPIPEEVEKTNIRQYFGANQELLGETELIG